jgi:hypothetical protein
MRSNKAWWQATRHDGTTTRCGGRTQGKIQRQNKNNETQRKKILTKISNPQHKCKWKHANWRSKNAKNCKIQSAKGQVKRKIPVLYKILGFTRRSVGMWCLQPNLKFLRWLNLETWPGYRVKPYPVLRWLLLLFKNPVITSIQFSVRVSLMVIPWKDQTRMSKRCPGNFPRYLSYPRKFAYNKILSWFCHQWGWMN